MKSIALISFICSAITLERKRLKTTRILQSDCAITHENHHID